MKDQETTFTPALTGTLCQRGRNGLVELDRPDPEAGRELFIPEKHLGGAPFGMKVVVERTGSYRGRFFGRVVEVLGDPGSEDVLLKSIIRQYQLRDEFSEEVEAQLENYPVYPDPQLVEQLIQSGRKDLRHLETLTIDGLDARDLDDAVDVEKLQNGYRLWVHIADVTEYLPQGSALDREALARGNSVYLSGQVIPMLPPKLSNGLCSLNPGKDRLALSCRVDFDYDGRVFDGEVCETVIQSKVRSSYEELREIFKTGTVTEERPEWFKKKIGLMREMAGILHRAKEAEGELDFHFPETVIELNDEGFPVNIYGEYEDEANEIIEAFMVAANEFVARELDKKHLPAIYRVHEDPDTEKIEQVLSMLKERDFVRRVPQNPQPKDLQALLKALEGTPYEESYSSLILRSLAKARYDVEDLGHFGLASEAYCHFTAPIRRYSDVCVHRALKSAMHGQRSMGEKKLIPIADHISETERIAVMAERDVMDLRFCEYYEDKLGEEFNGKISGLAAGRMFIELESTAEGSVPYASLPGGYIAFDRRQLMATDTGSGEIYALGDRCRVAVAAVNKERRFLDFKLLSHEPSIQAKGRR